MCLQEIKCAPRDVTVWAEQNGYHASVASSMKAGYAGVATLSKLKPEEVIDFQWGDESEARVITVIFESFVVVNIYAPYLGIHCQHLEKRVSWQQGLINFVRALPKDKAIILAGDFNVAHTDLDVAPCERIANFAGCTEEERREFQNLLELPLWDSFRVLYPSWRKYSFWSYSRRCRERNAGWRYTIPREGYGVLSTFGFRQYIIRGLPPGFPSIQNLRTRFSRVCFSEFSLYSDTVLAAQSLGTL